MDVGSGDAAGFDHGAATPLASDDVVGRRTGEEQVHRHHAELQRCAAL